MEDVEVWDDGGDDGHVAKLSRTQSSRRSPHNFLMETSSPVASGEPMGSAKSLKSQQVCVNGLFRALYLLEQKTPHELTRVRGGGKRITLKTIQPVARTTVSKTSRKVSQPF